MEHAHQERNVLANEFWETERDVLPLCKPMVDMADCVTDETVKRRFSMIIVSKTVRLRRIDQTNPPNIVAIPRVL